MKTIELSLSQNYVSHWGFNEAIRELKQNAIDGEKDGYTKEVVYNAGDQSLRITTKGINLNYNTLLLGTTSKKDNSYLGQFGEGYKLALLVLTRNNYNVEVHTNGEIWRPYFEKSKVFGSEVLKIKIEKGDAQNEISFIIPGISPDVYQSMLDNEPNIEFSVNSPFGMVLLDSKDKGKIFVDGLYVTEEYISFGYNFTSDVLKLDRDRQTVDWFDLKTAMAQVLGNVDDSKWLYEQLKKSMGDLDFRILTHINDNLMQEIKELYFKEYGLTDNVILLSNELTKYCNTKYVVEPKYYVRSIINMATDNDGKYNSILDVYNNTSKLDKFKTSSMYKLITYVKNNYDDELSRIVEDVYLDYEDTTIRDEIDYEELLYDETREL